MIVFLIIISYILGCLAAYFIRCYTSAKRSPQTGKYESTLGDDDAFIIFFWPVTLPVYVILTILVLTEKMAINLKELNNPKEIDVKEW